MEINVIGDFCIHVTMFPSKRVWFCDSKRLLWFHEESLLECMRFSLCDNLVCTSLAPFLYKDDTRQYAGNRICMVVSNREKKHICDVATVPPLSTRQSAVLDHGCVVRLYLISVHYSLSQFSLVQLHC